MINSSDIILKNNHKCLILKKNNKYIFKISQRAGSNLEKEYSIIRQLQSRSVRFSKVIPKTFINKNKISSLGKFFYIQDFKQGKTLSSILRKKLNQKTLKKLINIKNEIYSISKENLFINSTQLPSILFTKLIMNEFETLKKKEHLKFLTESKEIKINNVLYKNLDYQLSKTLESKKFKIVDEQKNYFSNIGHFNFHGENIIISDINKNENFFIIDPDPRWNCLDPLFSFARFIYSFNHDTIEYGNYILESNLFNLNNNKINSFKISYTWKNVIFNNYKIIFENKYFLKNETKFFKERFNYNYLICLLRGINSNYEEKIDFPKKKINHFRHSSIYLALMVIKFLSENYTNE